MSFRQPKSHRHATERAWRQWLTIHEPTLKEAGLPPAVTFSENHWLDLLQNGALDWHPESGNGFFFDQLSRHQMSKLLEVLDASPKYIGESMTGWLRHRLGRSDEESCSQQSR